MLVLIGLTGPLDCKTRRGSSQELMVSLETAPAWSCSGCLWSASTWSLTECEGSDWDLNGSEGFTSWLLLHLFTRSLSHSAVDDSARCWPTIFNSPPSSLSSQPPLKEQRTWWFTRSNQRRWKTQFSPSFRICLVEKQEDKIWVILLFSDWLF